MAIKLNYDTLIKEVEKRSPLWDRRDSNHNDMHLVAQLWEEISRKLNAPVAIIKKRWRNLRNQFRLQYNKLLTMQKGKSENITLKSNWLFFESLLFLISEMEYNSKKQHDYEKTEENQSKQNTDNSLENDSKFLETTIIDEDEAFFQSLIPHIEKMEPERRLLCRIEIQNVIYNFAYKENK